MNSSLLSIRLLLARWLPLVLLACANAGGAVAQTDPPARVASLSHVEGSVVLAPAGETEWAEATINRPITQGDRLWTDPGARAEVHLGSAALHMDSQTFVELVALDEEVLQLSLNEGVVNARVRQLARGDNFEITTPHLAFRASQPGDYRIDADPVRGITRVTVRSGVATIQGAGSGSLQLTGGQQMAFAGRDLAPAYGHTSPVQDGFDRWAADRNRAEDQSISARYVPRDVVGYHQLDANGIWSHDPSYGAVWYPRVLAADWAPYRYGRWEWIVPWGWTWIDDAPWGFAPSHYGRWAQIGSRWAWVPGRIGPRPVYSPALVVFVGGNSTFSFGSAPSIGWFPLAPGEAWRPTYRASSLYLRNANRNIFAPRPGDGFFFHRHRPDAITTVRTDDFNRGRPVHQHWSRVNPADVARVPILPQPMLPEPRRWADSSRGAHLRGQPGVQPVMPAIIARPQPQFQPPAIAPRQPAYPTPGESQWRQRPPEDRRGQQIEQHRGRRDQQLQFQSRQERAQQLQPEQQVQIQRRRDAHEREQRDHAARQQLRREQAIRQQAAGEQFQRQQQWRQERAIRQQLPQAAGPAPRPQAVQPAFPQHRAEGRGRGHERGWSAQQRGERAARSGDDGGRGRGRGQRPVN